jgi:hypothetical protein
MNAETTTALQTRQPLNIDMRQGVGITNYDEAMQMAALVHNSGLAPGSLNTVQKVAVGMLMAVEVGLPVITGLQNIAVINGKAGIWGDAILSLVRSSGQMEAGYPKERSEGTPFTDDWIFFCTVKRKKGQEVTGSFSWAEAKRAGLDSPKLRSGGKDIYSPWTRFPRRMMQWKARQWVYRDEFGDVLRGMRMAEELHDVIDMETSATGDYSMPAPGGQDSEAAPTASEALETKPGFDDLIPEDVDRGMVEQYAAQCAQHFEQDLSEFKRKIASGNQMEDFLNAFRGWATKQPKPEKEPEQKAEPTPQEVPPEDPGPWGEFRNEFINLRQAGFSTWVFKNKDRLSQAPQEIQEEAKAKWDKLYSGNQWPLDTVTEDTAKTEEPETHPHGDGEKIPAAWDMPGLCEPYIEKLGEGTAYEIMNTDNPAQIPEEERLAVIEALRKAVEG